MVISCEILMVCIPEILDSCDFGEAAPRLFLLDKSLIFCVRQGVLTVHINVSDPIIRIV